MALNTQIKIPEFKLKKVTDKFRQIDGTPRKSFVSLMKVSQGLAYVILGIEFEEFNRDRFSACTQRLTLGRINI